MDTNYFLPYGARVTNAVISSKEVSNIANKMFAMPDVSKNNKGMWNKSDALAPQGFLSQLGRKPQTLWGDSKKTSDYGNRGGRGKVGGTRNDPEATQAMEMNNSFTQIPRLMGLLGQYVTPASKVSMTELYQMSLDGAVAKILRIAKALIIANTGELIHSNPVITKLYKESIENAGGIHFKMRALDFLMYGFAVGEIAWGTNDDYYNVVNRVTFAPPNNIQFRINALGEMDAALQPNLVASEYGIFPGADLNAPESVFSARQLIPNTLPFVEVERDNLFYTGIDNTFDPYGVAPLRTAYKYFMMKNLALEMLMTALSRNGVPTLAVYYQKDMIKNDAQKTEFQEYIDSLAIGGALYLPGRKGSNFEVEPIRLDSSGIGIFLDFCRYCDEMMSSALSFPNGLISSGEGSSFAQSDIQKQTFEETLCLYTDIYKLSLQKDIVEKLVEKNSYEDYKKRNFGTFAGKTIGLDSQGKLAKIFELLANGGVVNRRDLDDVNKFREAFGLNLYTSESQLPDIEDLVPAKSMRDSQGTYSNQEFDKGVK